MLMGCSESLAAAIVETQCWIHKISGSSRESGPVSGDQGSYEQDLLLGTERRKRLETLVRSLGVYLDSRQNLQHKAATKIL